MDCEMGESRWEMDCEMGESFGMMALEIWCKHVLYVYFFFSKIWKNAFVGEFIKFFNQCVRYAMHLFSSSKKTA
jgi:cbb3-type cytochrome oxidase subunit 3